MFLRPGQSFAARAYGAGVVLMLGLIAGTQACAQGKVTSSSSGFGTHSGQVDPAPNSLFCGLPVNTALGLNHTDSISAAGYQLKLSLDANFGGIGTGITLSNPANNAGVNLVQTASAAGAGWQTSYFVYDTAKDRLIVFNQGAGNDVGYQWGYSNTMSNLTELGWTPLWSDHYHPTYSKTGFASQVGTSPCLKTGFHFDDGRGSIVANPIETPYGNVTHVTNSYQLRSNTSQSWGFVGVEQALYLNGVVAVQSNLQIILVGKTGWVEGPFRPTGKFSIRHGSGSCTASGCSYETGPDVAYVLLNYVVGNQSYGIAISEPNSRAIIIQTQTPYCTSLSDPGACGAVQIHSFLTSNDPVQIPAGQVRNYGLEYYIGTSLQLNAIGFDPVEGTNVGSYTAGKAATCTANMSAASNSQFPGAPVSSLISNRGVYSSNQFPGSRNNNGTFANVTSAAHGAGHIRLSARFVNGQVNGFPNVYKLYAATTDGSADVDLGVFNAQPDSSGTVDVPLGFKLDTNRVSIVPVMLGQDIYLNYYLQLTGMQVCN